MMIIKNYKKVYKKWAKEQHYNYNDYIIMKNIFNDYDDYKIIKNIF